MFLSANTAQKRKAGDADADISAKRPRGRAPKGKMWDGTIKEWVDVPK